MAGPPSASLVASHTWSLGHSQQEAMGRKEWVSSHTGKVTLARLLAPDG